MFPNSHFSRRSRETWKYALIGGLASVPLTLGLYWQTGMGDEFSYNMVFFGGLLAGYLAKRGSVRARSAGIRAGVIGGLPGLVWILPSLLGTTADFVRTWPFPPAGALFGIFFGVVILAIPALAGLLGGIVGGWLSKKIERRRASGVST